MGKAGILTDHLPSTKLWPCDKPRPTSGTNDKTRSVRVLLRDKERSTERAPLESPCSLLLLVAPPLTPFLVAAAAAVHFCSFSCSARCWTASTYIFSSVNCVSAAAPCLIAENKL